MQQDIFENTAALNKIPPDTIPSSTIPREFTPAPCSGDSGEATEPAVPTSSIASKSQLPATKLNTVRRESLSAEDLPESLRAVIGRRDTWLGRGDTAARKESGSQPASEAANGDLHYHQNLPTGFAALNAKLCEQGWPLGTTIEVLSDASGMGAMGLFLPAMEALSRQQRWQAFIAPPYTPYAPLLAARGIDTQQVLLVHPRDREEQLWSTEQALRSGTCSAVFSWLGHGEYRYAELRRLQLAAAQGNTLAVLFRSQDMAHQHAPASLRLQMQAYREVHILKQRSGPQGINVFLPPEDDVPHQPQLWELPIDGPMTQNQQLAS